MRLRSSIPFIDTILKGGFVVGGLYIIQGAPGAGKTILTNQICFNHIANGGKALYVTLLAENHARMLANLRELSFFDETQIPDRLSHLSAFAELRGGGLKALGALIRREVVKSEITVLVIDGLVSARDSAPDDQSFKVFIHDLQEVALATDCTMFLTTNPNKGPSPEETMVDGLIVLTDRIYGWQAVSDLQVLKFRGGSVLRGRHSYKITSDGFIAYPRIEELYAYPSQIGEAAVGNMSIGIAQLDAMLGGGLPTASTTMLLGPSGIGKTTTGLHFLSGSSAQEPGLMFGFYETPARLRIRSERFSPSLGPLFDTGDIEVMWQTPTSDPLDAYGERLLRAVKRRNVKRLFIDGLTAFQNSSIDASRIGNFFSALANELRVLGVTTVYSLEVHDILVPGLRVPVDDAASLAENMISLRFVERGSRVHRIISILKVRDSGFDPALRKYIITETGIQVGETSGSVDTLLANTPDRTAGGNFEPAAHDAGSASTKREG